MAETTLTPVEVTLNTASADIPVAGGTAINAANTMKFLADEDHRYLVCVNNTTAGAKEVTFVAGDFWAKGIGNLVYDMAQDDVRFFVLESARFKDNDGYVNISFEAAMTGFVFVLKLPK